MNFETRSHTDTNKNSDIKMSQHQQHQQQKKSSFSDIFNSLECAKFLAADRPETLPTYPTSSGTFLSKDLSLPSFDSSSIFNSRDAFSSIFASKEWDFKMPKTASAKPLSKNADDKADDRKKPLLTAANFQPQPQPLKMTIAVAPALQQQQQQQQIHHPCTADVLSRVMTSAEWATSLFQNDHVDIRYDGGVFSSSDSEAGSVTGQCEIPEIENRTTDWEGMFFDQLQLVPPSSSQSDRSLSVASIVPPNLETEAVAAEDKLPLQQEQQVGVPAEITAAVSVVPIILPEPVKEQQQQAATAPPQRKKRKRKPRMKVVPKVKEFVEMTDLDVLCGRGGRSNHHPGNKKYREEVENLRKWYMESDDKNEKTDLSQCLVDYVRSYGGRFIELDKEAGRWYIVPNIVARRKASQALREDNDAEKRAAKRERHKEKKKQEAMQQG